MTTTDFYALETSLLKQEVRASRQQLDLLLDEDFVEIGSSGIRYSKQDLLKLLPGVTDPIRFSITGFNTRELAPGFVLNTFTLSKHGEGATSAISLRSSLWRDQDGRWRMVFHQGTAVKNS